MDSEEERETEMEINDEDTKNSFQFVIFRLILALFFTIFLFFSSSIFIAFIAVLLSNFSITSPIYFPSQCRIVSSSVDLRSSKVCELGFLNYKAKHVFYPFEGSKFRCRYDYYWASVFEVEYKDHSLGHTRLAFAEAPSEALPLNCRPNFGIAWLTKDKFEVNKTYDCWYIVGFSKVSLYRDDLFLCQAKDPSIVEMMRRYIVLFVKIFSSWLSERKGKANYWIWETIAGGFSGFLTSLFTICFIRILHYMKSQLPQINIAKLVTSVIKMVFLRRACFFVAYFSILGWLLIQYGRKVGLPEIYKIYNY